jgi:hypothetical protein
VVDAETFLTDFQLPLVAVIWYPLILNLVVLASFDHLRVTDLSALTADTLLTLEMLEFTVAALVAEVIPKKPTLSATTSR